MAAGKGSAKKRRPAAVAAAAEEGVDVNQQAQMEQVEEEQPSTAPRAEEVEKEAEEAEDVIPLEAGASQPMQTTSSKKKKRRAADGSADDNNDDGGEEKPRVVYVGHIPHGFFEKEMKGFFSQFGTVTRLRLSRNKKTAKSKGYAFVEFDSPAVAAIATGAMDNYLMFGQMLQCKLVCRCEPEVCAASVAKVGTRTAQQTGIDYQFEGYAGSLPSTRPKRKVFEAEDS
eukprot:jgi/Chlat1/1018/Chrsp109S01462